MSELSTSLLLIVLVPRIRIRLNALGEFLLLISCSLSGARSDHQTSRSLSRFAMSSHLLMSCSSISPVWATLPQGSGIRQKSRMSQHGWPRHSLINLKNANYDYWTTPANWFFRVWSVSVSRLAPFGKLLNVFSQTDHWRLIIFASYSPSS